MMQRGFGGKLWTVANLLGFGVGFSLHLALLRRRQDGLWNGFLIRVAGFD